MSSTHRPPLPSHRVRSDLGRVCLKIRSNVLELMRARAFGQNNINRHMHQRLLVLLPQIVRDTHMAKQKAILVVDSVVTNVAARGSKSTFRAETRVGICIPVVYSI